MNNPSYKMLERNLNGNTILNIIPLSHYVNYSSQTVNKLYNSVDYNSPDTNYQPIFPARSSLCNVYNFGYMQSAVNLQNYK